MAIYDKIKDEKLQHDSTRETAEISALLYGKVDKYKYLTGKEILLSDQKWVRKQAKLTYIPLGKTLEKQRKTIEDQGLKQIETLNTLKSRNRINWKMRKKLRNSEIKNEIDDIKNVEEKINRKDLIYKASKYQYDFQQFETKRSFRDSICTGKINIDEAEKEWNNLLENMVKFNTKFKPKTKGGEDKKTDTFDSVNALYEGWQLTLNAFKRGIFLIKEKPEKGLKILTLKPVLERLPIALSQVKAGNTSEN